MLGVFVRSLVLTVFDRLLNREAQNAQSRFCMLGKGDHQKEAASAFAVWLKRLKERLVSRRSCQLGAQTDYDTYAVSRGDVTNRIVPVWMLLG